MRCLNRASFKIGAGLAAALAMGTITLSLMECSYSTLAHDVPPYGISFYFKDSNWPSPDTKAYAEGESIPAHVYSWKFRPEAPPPDMLPHMGFQGDWYHWLTLIVTDPDRLVYLWQRQLSRDQYVEELKRWQTRERGIHFGFDLQDWVPKGFRWKAGPYRVKGTASVERKAFKAGRSTVFMKEVTTSPLSGPATPLLTAELEANKQAFQVGETIVLRGYLKNQSDQPFMIQTHLPFREARLIAKEGSDRFPAIQPTAPLRLSHFTRLEPQQQILFFQESFVAGQVDPHWAPGVRRAMFFPPFAAGMPRTIFFRLESKGIFPEDRQPQIGIWTGRVESNSVKITPGSRNR